MLPEPPWTLDLRLPADPVALPARRGLCALEDRDGRTLALAGGADVRRLARSRLARAEGAARVLALTTASSFEEDWAWLAAARTRLPDAYAAAADRYRAWFVHVDPGAAHPRFTRAARPGSPPADGAWLGPVPTPRAATRYVELLEEAFDLCRYHHVLVQAPHGAACAYKEMGRCPAPCDGSISMDEYRRQVEAALAFASAPAAPVIEDLRAQMEAAAARLDFEAAEQQRRRLATLAPAAAPDFAAMGRLDRFRFLAVHRGERRGTVRLTVVLGGWIAPWLDAAVDDPGAAAAAIVPALRRWRDADVVLGGDADVNLGLVCRRLLRPEGDLFLPLDAVDEAALAAAIISVRA